jgi:hypothetical protein
MENWLEKKVTIQKKYPLAMILLDIHPWDYLLDMHSIV